MPKKDNLSKQKKLNTGEMCAAEFQRHYLFILGNRIGGAEEIPMFYRLFTCCIL